LKKQLRILKFKADFQHKISPNVEKSAVCREFIVKLHKEQKSAEKYSKIKSEKNLSFRF